MFLVSDFRGPWSHSTWLLSHFEDRTCYHLENKHLDISMRKFLDRFTKVRRLGLDVGSTVPWAAVLDWI